MNAHSSIPALAVSFALLGVVAWIAVAHPDEGRLFAPSAPHADAQTIAQPAAPAAPRRADPRR